MATSNYGGYGIKSWGGITPTGPVEIPQLGGAPAVAPKFKPKNELAGYAAKMVSELAYGAMAEKMAPQYIGYNEILEKDVYRIQPGSQQFAGEGGWDAGPNGVFEYQVPRLLKEWEIKRAEELESQFESHLLDPPKGVGDRGVVDASGNFFTPSMVQPTVESSNETIIAEDQKEKEWDPTSPKGDSFIGTKDGVQGWWKYRDPVYPMGGYGEVKEGGWVHHPIPPEINYEIGSTYTLPDGTVVTFN